MKCEPLNTNQQVATMINFQLKTPNICVSLHYSKISDGGQEPLALELLTNMYGVLKFKILIICIYSHFYIIPIYDVNSLIWEKACSYLYKFF